MAIHYEALKVFINNSRLYKKECDDEFKRITEFIDQLTPGKKYYEKKDHLLGQKECKRHNKHYASMTLKFYIYTYNKDLTNMEKQHNKLTAYELEGIEKLRDDPSHQNTSIRSIDTGKVDEGTGEGGLIMMADVLKDSYKSRKDMIEITKKL